MISSEVKTYASDQGHYYWPDGRTAYEVPYKDKKRSGELRSTTINDCRELGLYPSVTTIMKVMGKGDALTHWIKKSVAEAAWEVHGWLTPNIQEDWIYKVLEVAETQMSKQRDIGSEAHGEVERYFAELVKVQSGDLSGFVPMGVSRPVEAVISAFGKLGVAGDRIDSEKSFASPLGFGGKIDVSGRDEWWVVDMKFVDRLEKKKDYIEKACQGAAYLVGKYGVESLSKGRFANVFVETQGFNFEVREWTSEELQHGWATFSCCFALWKVVNKYDPVLNESKLQEVSFSKIV